jgi:hypothetical protein
MTIAEPPNAHPASINIPHLPLFSIVSTRSKKVIESSVVQVSQRISTHRSHDRRQKAIDEQSL